MGRLDAPGEAVGPMNVRKMRLAAALGAMLGLVLAPSLRAHVGSPDVYYESAAGPYRIFVTVRVPQMIPGVAQVDARILEGSPSEIRIVPLRLVGEGSETAPPPDKMEQSAADPKFFTGRLWLMESGSWQVRMQVSGPQGKATLAVPVAAFAQRTLRMQRNTGAILSVLMVLLVLSFIAIFGAATREGQVDPGASVPPKRRTTARFAMVAAAVAVLAILFLGNMWWTSIAEANAQHMVYKAPPVEASLVDGNKLVLKLLRSDWHEQRKQMQLNEIIPDHGHLMHLFLIRMPEMDRFYHLHPERTGAIEFDESLPATSAGKYAVFADIVRESGFPDTMTAQIELPERGGAGAPSGDDSAAAATPLSSAVTATTAAVGGDERVEWVMGGQALRATQPVLLRFRATDKNGAPATDLEPYMGMAGHLVIVRRDLSVFAHIHPEGSVPMAALMLTEQAAGGSVNSMAGMQHEAFPAEITFPYGFPQAGDYRLFLQIKRAGRIETAVFDARVTP
jgi:hypothetical protein